MRNTDGYSPMEWTNRRWMMILKTRKMLIPTAKFLVTQRQIRPKPVTLPQLQQLHLIATQRQPLLQLHQMKRLVPALKLRLPLHQLTNM